MSSTLKSSSTMASLQICRGGARPAAAADPVEESRELLAGLLAAVEALPYPPQAAHQLVARIDGDKVAVRPVPVGAGGADQQGFRVGGERGDGRVGRLDRRPGSQGKFGLRGARGARVESGRPAKSRVEEEECQPHRD